MATIAAAIETDQGIVSAAEIATMAILLHGTTRHRDEQILAHGPDPHYVEPGGIPGGGEFSTCLESGPFPLGTPEDYARRKAALFPNEGGAAILAVEVPDDIVAKAVDPIYFPLSQGIVQFDRGSGLEELCNAWPTLSKRIVMVEAG